MIYTTPTFWRQKLLQASVSTRLQGSGVRGIELAGGPNKERFWEQVLPANFRGRTFIFREGIFHGTGL